MKKPTMEDAQTQALREFGFSEYASRAYLALIELGPTDARSVSRVARIPPAKIYGTLSHLMEKGLARLVLEAPKRYEPVPFGDYLAQEKTARLEEAQRLAEIAPSLIPLFSVDPKQNNSDRGTFGILRGRRQVLQKHRQLASQARESLFLMPSRGALDRPSTILAILEDADLRGRNPRVLARRVSGKAESLRRIGQAAALRVQASSQEYDGSVSYAVFDRTQAIVTHHVPDDADPRSGHDVAVHVTQNAIAQSLLDLLETAWRHSIPPRDSTSRVGKRLSTAND